MDFQHFQLNEAVINQDSFVVAQVLGQLLVGDGHLAGIALDVRGDQVEDIAFLQCDPASLEHPRADLRALGVQQRADGHIQLIAYPVELFEGSQVGFMGAVGKIEPRDIHAGFDHLHDGFPRVACRPQGADNLCFAHVILLIHGANRAVYSIAHPPWPFKGRWLYFGRE